MLCEPYWAEFRKNLGNLRLQFGLAEEENKSRGAALGHGGYSQPSVRTTTQLIFLDLFPHNPSARKTVGRKLDKVGEERGGISLYFFNFAPTQHGAEGSEYNGL